SFFASAGHPADERIALRAVARKKNEPGCLCSTALHCHSTTDSVSPSAEWYAALHMGCAYWLAARYASSTDSARALAPVACNAPANGLCARDCRDRAPRRARRSPERRSSGHWVHKPAPPP